MLKWPYCSVYFTDALWLLAECSTIFYKLKLIANKGSRCGLNRFGRGHGYYADKLRDLCLQDRFWAFDDLGRTYNLGLGS